MLVYVDNQEVKIFNGCTAADAVRRLASNLAVDISYTELYDIFGNVIANDSPMTEGRHIFTVKSSINPQS